MRRRLYSKRKVKLYKSELCGWCWFVPFIDEEDIALHSLYSCFNESMNAMRGSRKFCQRGSNSDNVFGVCFFQLMRGKRASECHPKAGHHRSTSETPVLWRRFGPPVPPLDPRMNVMNIKQTTVFVCQRGSNSDNVFGCVFSS